MKYKVAVLLMVMGLLLVLSAASLFMYNRWDEDRASLASSEMAQSFMTALQDKLAKSPAPSASALPGTLPGASAGTSAVLVPGAPAATENLGSASEPYLQIDNYNYIGVIAVPTLNVSLPVMDVWSYDRLKVSPCRYTGSIAGNNIVIAAHNYSRHFGRISQLAVGDPVTFTDAAGVVHHYTVDKIETLNPTSIREMTDSGYALTMFTCTYSGQARVTVRCVSADTAEQPSGE